MQAMLRQYQPSQSVALTYFYQSHQLMKGDVDSLGKASSLLDDVIKGAGFYLRLCGKNAGGCITPFAAAAG
jgi:hypothetical protein